MDIFTGVASQIRPIIKCGHLQCTTPDWWWEFLCDSSWETRGQPFHCGELWFHVIFLARQSKPCDWSWKTRGQPFYRGKESWFHADCGSSQQGRQRGRKGWLHQAEGWIHWMVCYGKGEPDRHNSFIRETGLVCKIPKQKLQLSWSPRAPCPHFHLAHMLTWTHG